MFSTGSTERAIHTLKDIKFNSYDYDMDEEVVKTFNPGSILPITILLKDKKELDRINGEVSKEKIIEMIERNK